MKEVTETAAAVVGQEDRDGLVRAQGHGRERLLVCRTKKQVMDTFLSEVSRCHPWILRTISSTVGVGQTVIAAKPVTAVRSCGATVGTCAIAAY